MKDGSQQFAIGGVNSEIARISPDGESLLVGDFNGNITEYSIHLGQKIRELKGSLGIILDIEFSHDGTHMAACARGRSLCVWNLESGSLTNRVTNLEDPRIVAWSPNSDERLEVVGFLGTHYTFDTRHKQLKLVHQSKKSNFKAMKYSPNGTLLITSHLGTGIQVENAKKDGTIRSIHAHGGNLQVFAVESSGRRLVTGGKDRFVHLWDQSRPDPDIRSTDIRGGVVSDLAYSPKARSHH